LKNLTRHMIGDAPGSDTTLVDNVISEAIARTYKRVGLRYANPVPTFSDLRDELAQWQDEEKDAARGRRSEACGDQTANVD
jgi:hypothetical protein